MSGNHATDAAPARESGTSARGDAEYGESWLKSAAWNWVYTDTRHGRRLHHLARTRDPLKAVGLYWRARGVSTCGIAATWVLPGVLDRMHMQRCARCCDLLGWPRGVGSPKNDPELRPLVEAELNDE